MKYRNKKLRFGVFDLQLFAEGEDPDGGETGGDDQDGREDPDEDGEENEEKKFSQKDVDEAVKKRLAREKRRWQRQQRQTPNKHVGSQEDTSEEDGQDEETQELRKKAAKAEEMELKWACLEHDVDRSCVDDVLALAKVHMSRDTDMDIEDAIEKVLKKYPNFKTSSSSETEEEKGKSWGQRQTGKGAKKMSGVESRFYELNPDLKK